MSGVSNTKLKIHHQEYMLYDAIFQNGDSKQGHYVAYIRKHKAWILADDTSISKHSWPRLSKNVYLLLYKKIV